MPQRAHGPAANSSTGGSARTCIQAESANHLAVRRAPRHSLPSSGTVKMRAMAEIVLRVRLVGGDHLDVSYDEPGTAGPDEVAEHVISALAQNSGVLRARHGDRLVVLFGRGVAAIEVAPRGAVL